MLLTRKCVSPAYALAELIDNALSATAHNKGERTIEIRLVSVEQLKSKFIVIFKMFIANVFPL